MEEPTCKLSKQNSHNSSKGDKYQCHTLNSNHPHPHSLITNLSSNSNGRSQTKSLLKNPIFNFKLTNAFNNEPKKVLTFNTEVFSFEKKKHQKPFLNLCSIDEGRESSKSKSTQTMKIVKSDETFNPFERRNKKYKSIVMIKKLNTKKLSSKTESNEDIQFLSKHSSNNPYCLIQSKVILDCDINRAPKLRIDEVKGKLLHGQSLTINAAGLVNGLRNQRDGVCFFGLSQGENCEIINDYIINRHDCGRTDQRRVFAVNFDLKTQTYYLRAIKETKAINKQMVHVRIESNVVIAEKKFVLIGSVLLSFESINTQECIQIKVFGKNNESPVQYIFDRNRENSVNIGKDKMKCAVVLNDPLVNDVQCIVKNEEDKWLLETVNNDEAGYKSGVWMVLDEKFAISDVGVANCKINKSVIRFSMYM